MTSSNNETAHSTQTRPPVEGKVVFEARSRDYGISQLNRLNDGDHGQNLDTTFLKFSESTATESQFKYPLKLLMPKLASSSECKWVYPITYGGGLVQGDNIHLKVEVGEQACVLVTTQSSTLVYKCEKDIITNQQFSFEIGRDALLAVLQDPVVCFKDANYRQKQDIHLNVKGNLIFADFVSAGRTARGEMWEFTKYDSCTSIYLGEDNDLVFKDSYVLHDLPNLCLKSSMKSYKVLGMMIFLGEKLENHCQHLIATFGKPKSFGASYKNDLIVTVSPVKYQTRDALVKGCVLKIVAESTTAAFEQVDEILKPLYPVLGGNPYAGKY